MPKRDPHDHVELHGIGLTLAEAVLVCEGLSKLWFSGKLADQMWFSGKLADQMWKEAFEIIRPERIDERWGVEVDGLLKRLTKLNQSEASALLRAAVRFAERREEPAATVLSELGVITRRQTHGPGRSK